jgi:hypothetical protein
MRMSKDMGTAASNFDFSDISASVYKQTDKGIYLVKVSCPTVGMYISGWTVRQSPKYPGKGLWVQPPAQYMGRGWKKTVEFSGDSALFDLIRDEILRAVDRFNRDKDLVVDVPDDLTQDNIAKGLDNIKGVWPDAEQISP